MAMHVCSGAVLQCSFGLAASSLMVLPTNRMLTANMPAANIMDNRPLVNIMPFGMCTSLANPIVASATSAAMGVLAPMPCIPATVAPWAPGASMVMLGNMPALNDTSTLMCSYGGVISVLFPGQVQEQLS